MVDSKVHVLIHRLATKGMELTNVVAFCIANRVVKTSRRYTVGKLEMCLTSMCDRSGAHMNTVVYLPYVVG